MAASLLILDACVLIDFVESDTSILSAACGYFESVAVARPVLAEVDDFSEEDAERLGLVIVDPELDLASEAARVGAGLSFQDGLCLLIAKRDQRVCVTNDRVLRRACESSGVEVLWGLQLLLQLVEAQLVTTDEALECGRAIAETNPYLTEGVFIAFRDKLLAQ